jgi:5'(3')-deoxyribonucleotidase
MAKINISINEVLRDFIGQFNYIYDKYLQKKELKEDEITSFNLLDHYDFKSIDELNSFLYSEASLEIFGHADQKIDGLMGKFNTFLMDIEDDEEHTIKLVSKEFNKSIPATLFFLSKTGCRIKNLQFVSNDNDEWLDADVLITANPNALNSKPENKVSVKINTPYNKDIIADYEIDSILEFINDSELRNKILTIITTITYEEIN